MRQHPAEKFLIYCGFDHGMEGEHKQWGKAMAGILSEYTNTDPITINQTAYLEKSKPEFNRPFLKALNIQEASILMDSTGNPYKYERGKGWFDIVVFHPNTHYINDRPYWLFEYGNQNVAISVLDIDINYPLMVLAYKKGEDINYGVPMDIIGS